MQRLLLLARRWVDLAARPDLRQRTLLHRPRPLIETRSICLDTFFSSGGFQ
jgi:hypothetical protein